ncbi:lipid-A-disaccharide kinase [Apibacter mensalis]|uniref:Tetraacyldisaccharide 4'-kinase n=1 Tax=Apibacter mensalis TaxID=1586267 RepID=A0A0X3AM94_9FLAO|nr:tetraacyldisaccharide 4'-kinase [Apibacter mensalis]CVK15500.1 lipid-A-disaccharide kinase [Apibacter mensalis]
MKIFLYPFAGLYWLITYIRNKFFDWGLLQSKSYKKPIITVGNLSVGGTGKSPFVIYLIDLLKDSHLIGVMSRGYGRKTKGFHFANYTTSYEDIGDEPMQFFLRFKNKIIVGVDEKRIHGIDNLIKDFNPNLFILDDAFQHRYVKAGLYILLTDYSHPYYEDQILPLGRLREGRYGAKRAQIVVVTKCPEDLADENKRVIERKLNLQPYQSLFFSTIIYEKQIISSTLTLPIDDLLSYHILLVTGIAKYQDILEFAEEKFSSVTHLQFKDHHNFSEFDIVEIEKTYQNLNEKAIILTTEKDFMRLKHFQQIKDFLFYLPINIKLDRPEEFKKLINKFVG